MHKISFSIVAAALLLLTACISDNGGNAQLSKDAAGAAALNDTANYTTLLWLDSVKSFQNIREGQKLEVVFRLRNTGSKPLVIQSVTPSCGCTIPQKPEEPIMPGAEASIKAVFDSQGRSGTNHKTLTVMANTKGKQSHVLEFNVEVIGSTEGPKAGSGPTAPSF
ncbi:MAG TPA: DUF1573 domain-containing protein [Phnomibacter sp.]|nr:DUF1573 domain-containing protein [Phnomibacter sp.]